MSRFDEMVAMWREAVPDNKPVNCQFLARIWWPGQAWIEAKTRSGGARRGARVAAGVAGRMSKRGYCEQLLGSGLDWATRWRWMP